MSGVAPDPLDGRMDIPDMPNTSHIITREGAFTAEGVEALVEIARAARAYTEDEANYERLVTALARLDKDVA